MKSVKSHHLFLFLLFSVVIVSSYLIIVTLKTPFIGLEVGRNTLNEWEITHVTEISWAQEKGIAVGDLVTSINGALPNHHPTVKQYSNIENIKEMGVVRNGELYRYEVDRVFIPSLFTYHTLFPTIAVFLSLSCSLFLYFRKKNDLAALMLGLFLCVASIGYLSAGGSARGDFIARTINSITFLQTPVIFSHFLYHYFKRFNIFLISKRLIHFLYLLNVVIVLISASFMIGEFGHLFVIARVVFLLVFSINLVLCLTVISMGYIRYKKTVYESVFKLLISGLSLVFLPFILLAAIPEIIWGQTFVSGELAAILLLILPVFLTYLVVANRLLDINFVTSRLQHYAVIALLPTLMFIFLLHFILLEATFGQRFQSVVIIYFGLIFTFYMKERLDYLIYPKLFKKFSYLQANLDRFAHDIGKVMTISELEHRILEEVKDVLPIKSSALFSIHKRDHSVLLRKGAEDNQIESIKKTILNEVDKFKVGYRMSFKDGMLITIGQNIQEYYILWIGVKQNYVDFNQDEKSWLKAMAHYTGIVYENLHLTHLKLQEIQESMHSQSAPPWILRLIFNLSEKERRNFAADLHDSVLQDQLLWFRKLKDALRDPTMPCEIRQKLKEIKEGFLDVIYQIRETCNNLRPPFLAERGLVSALQDLFEIVHLRSDYVIYFDADPVLGLDDEQTLAIYRIIQELLTNATKHAIATQVRITIENKGGDLNLRYEDNGIGFELGKLQRSTDHMGLTGISDRVLSFDGKINLHSSHGEGLSVELTIPLANKHKELIAQGESYD
ncbi:hypothetical protein BEP19_00590 [Ammoniphilus oxalaticus]|uniref:histidine kinase n=1 Tax=Ammoniphilus oxalaticus TaxID=66863 RepID=A0A419SRM9_9BACL|nr:ATP-binding protein [Ammoniphilus oxalaticus]RKD27103.1 hypothetical protein BEP19_00590 [Ammoniphilus oxalaticus]